MSNPSAAATFHGSTFRTRRTLPYAPKEIFSAFERPELLAQWWGPTGFTNTFETFEFKVGGHWKFIMHGPDDTHYPNENIFRVLQAPTKLVIEHVMTPHFTLTVTLQAQGTETEVIWNQALDDAALAGRIRNIIEPANEQNLDRLTAVLKKTGKVPRSE